MGPRIGRVCSCRLRAAPGGKIPSGCTCRLSWRGSIRGRQRLARPGAGPTRQPMPSALAGGTKRAVNRPAASLCRSSPSCGQTTWVTPPARTRPATRLAMPPTKACCSGYQLRGPAAWASAALRPSSQGRTCAGSSPGVSTGCSGRRSTSPPSGRCTRTSSQASAPRSRGMGRLRWAWGWARDSARARPPRPSPSCRWTAFWPTRSPLGSATASTRKAARWPRQTWSLP